jgi:hypothetical protein
LIAEATVDAYGDDEQRVGFLTMLEERLDMPFEVQILGSPAEVERIDEIDYQIVAICRSGRHRQAIPILELPDRPHNAAGPACGTEGRISNWKNTFWDLSQGMPAH